MDKIQQEFEAWLKSNDQLTMKEDNGEYSFQHTRFAFEAWKASRAALCVEIGEAYLQCNMMADYLVKDELDKAGVSYK